MMNAVLEWLSQGYRHVQRPDRQIPLHAVTNGPTDDLTRIQIKDNGYPMRRRAAFNVFSDIGRFHVRKDGNR
jgi:hypothetical protein